MNKSVFGITVVLMFVLSTLLTMSINTKETEAETWEQTNCTDFEPGDMVNVEIKDFDEYAYLQLQKKSESSIWQEQYPATKPSERMDQAMTFDSIYNKAILFGGEDAGGCLDDTWTYDTGMNKWQQMNPSNEYFPGPPERNLHEIVYDGEYNRTILFGGTDSIASSYNDTWVYNAQADQWSEQITTTEPTERNAFGMAYDKMYNKTVVFGGWDGYPDGETWVYDLGSNTWTRMLNESQPLGRHLHAMTYDTKNDRTILFGGTYYAEDPYIWNIDDTWEFNSSTSQWLKKDPSTHPTNRYRPAMTFANDTAILHGGWWSGYYNSTWTYNSATETWTYQTPDQSPSHRYGHAMAYDNDYYKAVLFGGWSFGWHDDETWLYDVDKNNWTQQTPSTTPPDRLGHAMVYTSNLTIMFGGHDGFDTYYNDTWVYDTLADDWLQRTPSPNPPTRSGLAMAYQPTNDTIVLFGGGNLTITRGDTWIYYCNNNTWEQMYPTVSPSARWGHTMCYDSSINRIILYGGRYGDSFYDDTWIYDFENNTWQELELLGQSPSGIYYTDMAYTEGTITNGALMFGGYNYQGYSNETWLYDYGGNDWTELTFSNNPSHRSVHALTEVYYNFSYQVVLFGGFDGSHHDDTWVYNPKNNTWNQKFPSTKPSARSNHAMAYDYNNGRVILFGGNDESQNLDETWVYDMSSNTWTKKDPKNRPMARIRHSMTFDESIGMVVLFGGYNDNGAYNDTWVYDYSNDNWIRVNIPIHKPIGRRAHTMIFDPNSGKSVMYGGRDWKHIYDDTWVYTLGNDTWTKMNQSVYPNARFNQAMVYDTGSQKVIMFGGYNGSFLNDTWVYDIGTNTWTEKFPSNSPPIRSGHSMAYSPVDGKVVLFGGLFDNGTVTYYDDTWIYDLNSNTWTQQSPSSNPSGRFDSRMVYIDAKDYFVLYGGTDNGGDSDETWIYELELDDWTREYPASKPKPRHDQGMVFDSSTNKIVLFGGYETIYNDETWIYNLDEYHVNGTFTSAAYTFDVYKFKYITWQAAIYDVDSLKFQIAVSTDGTNWNFVGPDGTSSTYYTEVTGGNIWNGHLGQYMRYKAYFERSATGDTPKLYSVTFTYDKPKYPSVKLTSPNGGEDWMKGMWYPLTWNAEGDFNSTAVSLYYSVNNGESVTAIVLGIANTGYYNWTVPSIETPSALIMVVITDVYGNTVTDASDASFAIDPPPPRSMSFSSPSFGSVWGSGTHTIKWQVENSVGLTSHPVSLKYSTDGGSTWTFLADGLRITDTFDWTINDDMNYKNCIIKLELETLTGDYEVINSPSFVIDTEAPVIEQFQAEDGYVNEELEITASITDNFNVVSAVLFYRLEGESVFRSQLMTLKGEDYTATIIPDTKGTVDYFIQASDGVNVVETEISEIEVYDAGYESDKTTDSSDSTSEKSDSTGIIFGLLSVVIILIVLLIAGMIYIRKRPKIEIRYIERDGHKIQSLEKPVKTEETQEVEVEKYKGYL